MFIIEGNVIFAAGDPSEAMFIVNEGHVTLLVEEDGQDVTFETLQMGDIFGEESLLHDDSRYYTVRPIRRTILLAPSVESYLAY